MIVETTLPERSGTIEQLVYHPCTSAFQFIHGLAQRNSSVQREQCVKMVRHNNPCQPCHGTLSFQPLHLFHHQTRRIKIFEPLFPQMRDDRNKGIHDPALNSAPCVDCCMASLPRLLSP